MQEGMDMRGQLTISLSDRDGRTVYERTHHNHIVKVGRQLVAQLFGGITVGTPPSKVSHMGIGTDATKPTDDQTSLLAQRTRNPISSVSYTEVTEDGVKRIKASLQTVFDFGEGNGAAPLREAAIFTAASGGVMYNRVVFDEVTKNNTFKLTLIWDVVF
jgi:hypothetical protein